MAKRAVAEPAEVYAMTATVGGEFENHAVVGAGVEVRGIAGGLQDPIRFSPVTFEHGETGVLCLWFTTKGVRFDPDDKDEPGGDVVRVSILRVDEAAFLDPSVVSEVQARQRAINDEGRRRLEEEKGIRRLEFAPSDDASFEFAKDHANGDHGSPVDGCPVCEVTDDGDEENPQAVMVRQHLAGVHTDGLRDECVMCQTEVEATRREAEGNGE